MKSYWVEIKDGPVEYRITVEASGFIDAIEKIPQALRDFTDGKLRIGPPCDRLSIDIKRSM